MENWLLRKTIKEEKAIAEAEIEQYQTTRRVTASMRSASAIVGSNVTRLAKIALEDLITHERAMYETSQSEGSGDDGVQGRTRKRDDVDPRPLFSREFCSCDPGLDWLRSFNDRQYNRDLVMLCERVNTAAPQLPDGRRLLFQVRDIPCPVLDMQKRQVA